VDALSTVLTVPDLWQQKAVNLLRAGHDVVIHAPTGAGKTYIFELLVQSDFPGKAVFTVPTRALANDKLLEWQAKGWNVGIETGDVSYNREAPIIVATLETQKRALMTGRGPSILVIDEYQMLADPARGVTYELALATAPKGTQLLLLSGSVANPQDVERWLTRCGRTVAVVRHEERPVPLDEINLDALRDRVPKTVRGRWPRYIARALAADLGPILLFAPRRKAAETLARTLASALPEANPLVLTPEQQAIAGPELIRCLKNRVAYHHSGMSYAQRAGLVEPLAKNNQLKVIVATTGLAAGINFSMRSVMVLEREYRVADAHRMLRPDELLQMFGRAGRRGMDERGTVLYLEGKPRLAEAKPLSLQRGNKVDWPSLLTVIDTAVEQGFNPLSATRQLTSNLFSQKRIPLGLEDFLHQRDSSPQTQQQGLSEQQVGGGEVIEFQNSAGIWERRRAPLLFKLEATYYLDGEHWRPGLSNPKLLSSIRIGTLCKLGNGTQRRYGIDAPLASFPQASDDDRLQLSAWLRKALRELQRSEGRKPNVPKFWPLERIERHILPLLPQLTRGGQLLELTERRNSLIARLDYARAEIHAYKDLEGKGLLNPKLRKRRIEGNQEHSEARHSGQSRSIAEYWYALGLIDRQGHPTQRGVLFSFFNHGEGLAVAAALEERTYPIEELIYDLANIRAGHRFNALAMAGRPLTAICQTRYGLKSIPGYLRRGLPEDYGEGASEILYNLEHKGKRLDQYIDDELSFGDIERARVEWDSIRAHIATAPNYDWDRWMDLKRLCQESLLATKRAFPFEKLPPLTREQRSGA